MQPRVSAELFLTEVEFVAAGAHALPELPGSGRQHGIDGCLVRKSRLLIALSAPGSRQQVQRINAELISDPL